MLQASKSGSGDEAIVGFEPHSGGVKRMEESLRGGFCMAYTSLNMV
jgi:hypothetical protein